MKFDELNQLKRYFSIMELPQQDKDKRVSLGLAFYDIFIYVFILMQAEVKIKGSIDVDYYVRSLDGRIRDALEENNIPYEDDYIPQLTRDIVETTTRHLDEPYYFSEERALLVAQNEANTVLNGFDYEQAKSKGKTHKTWVTEQDDKVRPWHAEVDLVTIPIDDMFHVGEDYMRFPHDFMNGSPDNLINCRCTCKYE